MNSELKFLINTLLDERISSTSVMPWACPIPSFGNIYESKIATVGLNPSNREFVDVRGREIEGPLRRFQTLNSLKLLRWSDLDDIQEKMVLECCLNYFKRNPYDEWFKKLDYIISGANLSYYFPLENACHLDLIPFATSKKWSDLSNQEKSLLLELSGDTLGVLLGASSIKMIVLNGITVIQNFMRISNYEFERKQIPSWSLPRSTGDGVAGYSYYGTVSRIGKIQLQRKVIVLGYNHNLQSSFGVTSIVLKSIRDWISTNC